VLPRRYHRMREVLDRRQPDLTVLTESVNKPHNLAAILRTCDAVGVFEAYAISYTAADPLELCGAALGSQKWIRLHSPPDLDTAIADLQARGYAIYAAHLSDKAVDYREVDYTQPSALLLGAEKWGVSDRALARIDKQVKIPMLGMVQSLNVSVAAATILFEAQRQRLAAGMYAAPRLDPDLYDRTLFEWGYPELAAACRDRGQPYPPLSENGELLDPSLPPATDAS